MQVRVLFLQTVPNFTVPTYNRKGDDQHLKMLSFFLHIFKPHNFILDFIDLILIKSYISELTRAGPS